MSDRTPHFTITASAFGEEDVDMRIPLKVTTESMKNGNEAGSKSLSFIHFMEHIEDGRPHSTKQAV